MSQGSPAHVSIAVTADVVAHPALDFIASQPARVESHGAAGSALTLAWRLFSILLCVLLYCLHLSVPSLTPFSIPPFTLQYPFPHKSSTLHALLHTIFHPLFHVFPFTITPPPPRPRHLNLFNFYVTDQSQRNLVPFLLATEM